MESALRVLTGICFAVAIGAGIATLNWLSISRSFAESGGLLVNGSHDPLAGAQQWAIVTLVALIGGVVLVAVVRAVELRTRRAS